MLKKEIRFIGPLGKVTGSCSWMRDIDRGWSFLIDCGMQQGERTAEVWNSCEDWPFEPSDLKFIVLTHAHTDHCGLIPELYKRGFEGTVYCTKETRDIATLLLRDAASFPDTAYEEQDVEAIKWHAPGRDGKTRFGNYHPVDTDLFIQFFRSGHILGGTSVKVLWGPKGSGQRSIVFSGDVGPGSEKNEVLPFLRFPMHPTKGTFSVLESTYGNVVRDDADKDPTTRRHRLKALLDEILESNGTLAIPAFAVGRTQDVLFDLHYVVASDPDRYQSIQFLLDGPSAIKMNQITAEALKEVQVISQSGKVRPLWLGKQVFSDLGLQKNNPSHLQCALDICDSTFGMMHDSKGLRVSDGNSTAKQWRGLISVVKNRKVEVENVGSGPHVVVMGSGTGDGGPAATWLPKVLLSQKNIVAMSGYCSSGTIGGKLLELQNVKLEDRAFLSGELIWQKKEHQPQARLEARDIRAKIARLSGYSGHADQADLLNWLFEHHKGHTWQMIGRTVFLQHGEDYARDSLGNAIEEKARDHDLSAEVIKPKDPSKWFDLELDEGFDKDNGDNRVAELEEKIRLFQEEIDRIKS
ncbi:MBL fold metallo-hydrolase [Halomonas sp. CS7]|uniref:MBL fold metallo-hydrolase n=1 Tax=Halomonas pelophila TaxID=3151122 RepID=A0ABV1N4C6_9GAMM